MIFLHYRAVPNAVAALFSEPGGIDIDEVEAASNNGVLTVR
jgi:hypothetical protein